MVGSSIVGSGNNCRGFRRNFCKAVRNLRGNRRVAGDLLQAIQIVFQTLIDLIHFPGYYLCRKIRAASCWSRLGLGYCQEVQGKRFSGQAKVGKAFSCERAIGYVMGVSDSRNETNVCQPTGLNSNQLRDVMHLWLKDNPVKRYESAPVLIQKALLEAWPCPEE